jgi:hypothetical protein
MFENRVRRRIFGPKRDEVETYMTRSYIICSLLQMLLACSIKNDEMGEECSTHQGDEKCVQKLGCKVWGKETTRKN